MKKILFLAGFSLATLANAQVTVNAAPTVSTGQNTFLDASQNWFNYGPTIGRGLNFPRTNLTTWTFRTASLDGINYPSGYDGMVVYNTATGNTVATPATGGIQTAVVPGFYYFSNPNGSTSVTNGQWKPFSPAAAASLAVAGTAPVTVTTANGTATVGLTRNNLNSGASVATANAPVVITNGGSAVVNGADTSITVNNTAPLWNANQLNGTGVSGTPTTGQVLTYNGTNWVPAAAPGNSLAVWGLYDSNVTSRYTETGYYPPSTISSSSLTEIPDSAITLTIPATATASNAILNWVTTWRRTNGNNSPGTDNANFKITLRVFRGSTQVGSDIVIANEYVYQDAIPGQITKTIPAAYAAKNLAAGTYTFRIYVGNSNLYQSYSIDLTSSTVTGEGRVYVK